MSERNLFLGIDPGASGGIAILPFELWHPPVLVEKMPSTERDIYDTLAEFGPRIMMANIEAVHSMPKQGVASSFKFGMSYGGLRMALVALQIPFEAVTPQKWQKAMNCLSGGDKNKTKRRAQELFPTLKVTHATADSLLIAGHARGFHLRRAA